MYCQPIKLCVDFITISFEWDSLLCNHLIFHNGMASISLRLLSSI
uniref:Uncharacterized protein n=1 Tax=Rhizophora mucronata TaxID=61149 RepID=A0A2P2Q3Q6_RHIMU